MPKNYPSVKTYVKQVKELLSLSEVCIELNKLMNSPHCTAKAVEEIVSLDPGLTARLLKIVNSAYYGFEKKITTVSHAITIIGNAELQNLVLATSAVDNFEKIPSDLVDMAGFWHHSVACGLMAKHLASLSGHRNASKLFVAGLLHDIGRLIIFYYSPDEAKLILESANNDDYQLLTAEIKVLGFSHAQVGAELARVWLLPDLLECSISSHHKPLDSDPKFRIESLLIHIADCVADTLEPWRRRTGQNDPGSELTLDSEILNQAKVTQELIKQASDYTNEQTFDVMELIKPGSTMMF